jgi:glycosyltransferase involved in cell wall biosynthesis
MLSIVTVFKMGDLVDLDRTVSSVENQSKADYEHIIIASGISDHIFFMDKYKNTNRRIIINEDRSLYDAMNLGLNLACGNSIIYLNAGDEFYDASSIQLIKDHFVKEKCFAFRTIQYYSNDIYIRPSIARIENLKRYPGHQGFIAPLPLAKRHLFNGEQYPISADSIWMSHLISNYGIEISEIAISKFALGGISNNPSIKTITLKKIEFGTIFSLIEFIKYLLKLVFGLRFYYRIIYILKYEHFNI